MAMEKEIWHCVFCGKHWVGGPPTITARVVGKDHPLQCCPYCQDYKGLEKCDPNTCHCWEIRVVPEIMDILRGIDQYLATVAVDIITAMMPPKDRHKDGPQ